MLTVTGGSCTKDHRPDHDQTAAATNPERHRAVVGLLAAISHVLSPSTPRVVAGPPARPVLRRRSMTTVGCALRGLWCGLEPSVSRGWLSGIAAMLVVMLALVRSSLLTGLTFYLSRPALRASSALYQVLH